MNKLQVFLKAAAVSLALSGLFTVLGSPRLALAAEAGCTSSIYECERQDMPHINANCLVWNRDESTGLMTCVEWKKMPATYYMYTPPWP